MKEYLQMLIWVMLFVLVVEMIFPDSAYRKYLKLILGCIILYTLLNPLKNWLTLDGRSYDSYVGYYQNQFTLTTGQGFTEAYQEEKEKQQEVLKKTVKENMIKLIEKEVDVTVASLELQWEESNEGTLIKEINLIVRDKVEKGKIEIPRIQIGEKSHTVNGDETSLKNKIKTCLKNFYNVQVCNIHITVQKND
ncbi:hypothetical protein CS063_02455 [Sporanaerobium hydrogeniformans]|uniref:Uncharacterized protein n=1 Tax=Sporanaerobium hydrogeniformans TaxID=3072179 RepID=A0AC61DGE3_9FIRM|nr:stage III sporulation protein AF [Sporanaerobium hydrogeniformans]PHV72359.1 hypothetical protein CS063_02455 [Sporanaerobium hydrogeniformans]